MSSFGEMKGRIIFGAILIIVVIVSLAAYQMTGKMSIEDRYNTAVGPPTAEEEVGGILLGFSVEENPALYLIVLGIFCAGFYVTYIHAFQDLKIMISGAGQIRHPHFAHTPVMVIIPTTC
jgi:hypothetical protein